MSKHRYSFETFESEASAFDGNFSNFLNSKYDSGWKYKTCQFEENGDKRIARCLFKSD